MAEFCCDNFERHEDGNCHGKRKQLNISHYMKDINLFFPFDKTFNPYSKKVLLQLKEKHEVLSTKICMLNV